MYGFDLKQSFDTSASLALLFLWLIFNYLAVLLNCDLQRAIKDSALLRHVLGLMAFYFLFTVIDPNNNVPVWVTLVKTIVVYFLFVLATKARWIFAGTTLLLLFADQMVKNHIDFLKKHGDHTQSQQESWHKLRKYLLVLILLCIFTGAIDYVMKQKREQGKEFNYFTFFLGTSACKMS